MPVLNRIRLGADGTGCAVTNSDRLNMRLMLAAAAMVALTTPVLAQRVDAPGFRPGREGEAFDKPAQPKAGFELTVPEGAGGAVVPEAEQIQFDLSRLLVEGATVYSAEQLQPLYADLLARKRVSLADVYRAAEAITLKYRNDGYVLSRALVPAQRIRDGVVKLQVVEGYVDRLVIESEDIAADSRLRTMLERYLEKIKRSNPARIQDIERYLLLINDLAGVRGRAVIRPSEGGGVGASELVLVSAYAPVSGSLTIENYGSKYVGQWQALGEISASSLVGRGERFTVRTLTTLPFDELTFVQGSVAYPIGTEGLVLTASGQWSRAEPGFLLEPFKVDSDGLGYDVVLGYPIIRSRSENLTVQGGYRFRETDTAILGTTPAVDPYLTDQAHTLFGNLIYDFVDPLGGVNLVSVTVSGGAQESFLATGRVDQPDDRFVKLSGEAVRHQPLTEAVSLVVAADWQFSRDLLVSSERFAVGGKSFGRGYDPAEILGDSGAAAKAELRYTGQTGWDWFKSYTAYAFYDFGAVWRSDVPTDERQSLASAGIGFQASLLEWLAARLEMAKPLTRVPAYRQVEDSDDHKDPRFYLSLTAKF